MSEIIATVNGITITDADVDAFISHLPQDQQMYASNPEFRKHCSQQLVERELFSAWGAAENLEETEEFKTAMERTKKDLLGRLAVNRILENIKVSEEELTDYYANHTAEFEKGATANAKHILVADEDSCNKIKADIENGTISFEDAAKEHSTCPSGQKGGDLGEFGRGQMVPEFDEAVFNAETGKVIGPVKTQFGYHLIRVESLSEPQTASFEEVKPKIEYNLLGQKEEALYNAKVAELKEQFCK